MARMPMANTAPTTAERRVEFPGGRLGRESMKIYNAVGYACLVLYAAASFYFAPENLGPWAGLGVGMAYLVVCWFFAGVYLSCVIHMGIAHRALDYQEWFVKSLSVVNNTFGVYINPLTWVNRHRLHHRYA